MLAALCILSLSSCKGEKRDCLRRDAPLVRRAPRNPVTLRSYVWSLVFSGLGRAESIATVLSSDPSLLLGCLGPG